MAGAGAPAAGIRDARHPVGPQGRWDSAWRRG